MSAETYSCPDCPATFDDPVALGVHVAAAHPTKLPPL